MPAKSREPLISQRGMAYLTARGINAEEAAIRFGLFSAHAHDGLQSTYDDSANYLGIPYMRGLQESYLQFRDMREGIPHKNRYRSPTGATPAIFNVDAVDDPGLDDKPLTICEGALDSIATMQTGAKRVVGIPGAELTRLIQDAEADFADVTKIILAGHADEAGRNMNAALLKILSPVRCRTVEYPAGCNDMNDVLLALGRPGVIDCLTNAKFVRVKGVYRPSEVPRRPPLEVMKVSAFGSDFLHHIGICKRQLSIWTGVPGDGKSTLLKGLLWALMNEHGIKPAAAFYEDDFHDHTARDIAALHYGRPFTHGIETEAFGSMLKELMDDRWVTIEEVEDEVCTVEQFIEQAKAAIIQDGADFVLADPWSQFEVAHPKFAETEMIRRYIIELRNLAKQFNAHVAIVAHPKKHGDYGGTAKVADGNDIAGSLHFNGRCDLGVTVERDAIAENVTNISVWKVRRREMGKRGTFSMLFDEASGRYSPMSKEEVAFARGEDPANVIDFSKRQRRRSGARNPHWQDKD